jgi:hypothetical protein
MATTHNFREGITKTRVDCHLLVTVYYRLLEDALQSDLGRVDVGPYH